jgi:hydrogenase maturation protease
VGEIDPQPSVLIIGYGNDLRSDDGVGRRVAEAMSQNPSPEVRTLSVHQLTPELAEPLAAADLAIFVDAYPVETDAPVEVIELVPSGTEQMTSHGSSPQNLLAIAQQLYGRCPQAWWVWVPGVNFAVGDRLSATANWGKAEALDTILRLLEG